MANTPILQLTWIAVLNDGTEISQIDSTGHECPFQKVKDNFSNLHYFYLIHRTKGLKIAVDLKQGLLLLNDILPPEPDILSDKSNIRLIYFRRNKVILNGGGTKLDHQVTYFLGYQYNDKNGDNKKVLAQMDQQGNIILGDK